jgi:hypothetical protein
MEARALLSTQAQENGCDPDPYPWETQCVNGEPVRSGDDPLPDTNPAQTPEEIPANQGGFYHVSSVEVGYGPGQAGCQAACDKAYKRATADCQKLRDANNRAACHQTAIISFAACKLPC